MNICGIYIIISPKGRVYIGQSINIKARLRAYRNGAAKQQTLLGRSFSKYGYGNHNFSVLHHCEPDLLNLWEIFYIKLFNCFNTDHGLNLKAGGQNGGSNAEEVRAKLRKPKTEAAKEKYRMAAIGRYVSGETREKHRIRMMGNKYLQGSTHMIGFKHSDETKAIIKQKREGQIIKSGYKRTMTKEWIENIAKGHIGLISPKRKPVFTKDLLGNIKKHPSIKHAQNETKVDKKTITEVAGLSKYKKGYMFSFSSSF